MPQRLRRSRTARQNVRKGASTSDMQAKLALDATRVTAGHRKPRETQVGAVSPTRIAELLADAKVSDVQVLAVRKGSTKYRADVVSYRVDPSTL